MLRHLARQPDPGAKTGTDTAVEDQAAEKDPALAKRTFSEANDFFKSGDYASAIVGFERVRQMPGFGDDVHQSLLYNIGIANLRLERYATAITYIEQYLAMPGGEHRDFAEENLIEAKRGAGIPVEDQPAEKDPALAKRTFNQANDFFKSGDFASAIIYYERVRQMPGFDDDVHQPLLYNIGIANLRLQRYATAITYLEQYLAMPGGDNRDFAEENLIDAKHGAGIPVKNPALAERTFNEANDFFKSGDFASAIIYYERVRQMPGFGDDVHQSLLYNLGIANLRLRRFATAITYLEQYLAMPGGENRDFAEENLTDAKRGAGIPVEDQPAEKDPALAKRTFNQANDFFKSGDYASAIIYYERVRQMPGFDDDVHQSMLYNIGIANLRLRRFATAITYLEQYLAMPGGDKRDFAEENLIDAKHGAGIPG